MRCASSLGLAAIPESSAERFMRIEESGGGTNVLPTPICSGRCLRFRAFTLFVQVLVFPDVDLFG